MTKRVVQEKQLHGFHVKHCKYESTDRSSAEGTAVPLEFQRP
jgi:hypothetical protein